MNKLLPCPFCHERLTGAHRSHPINGCFLEGFEVGEDWVPAWNTRHTPEGWQLVPTHRPTIDMTEAGMCHVMRGQDYERAQACWVAMLAAAPKWGGE